MDKGNILTSSNIREDKTSTTRMDSLLQLLTSLRIYQVRIPNNKRCCSINNSNNTRKLCRIKALVRLDRDKGDLLNRKFTVNLQDKEVNPIKYQDNTLRLSQFYILIFRGWE